MFSSTKCLIQNEFKYIMAYLYTYISERLRCRGIRKTWIIYMSWTESTHHKRLFPRISESTWSGKKVSEMGQAQFFNPNSNSRCQSVCRNSLFVYHIDTILLRHTKIHDGVETFSALLALVREFTGHQWIACTKVSDAEIWYFLWSATWLNGWVNNREAGDWRRHRTHYDVIVML